MTRKRQASRRTSKTMSDQTQTYTISEHFIASRVRLLCVVCLAALLMPLFVNPWNIGFEQLGSIVLKRVLILVPIALTLILMVRYMFRNFRRIKLHVGPDGLVREAGARQQEVRWDSIKKVVVRSLPSGAPRYVHIFPASGRPISILPLEQMAGFVEQVEESVPTSTQFVVKRQKLDWENPLLAVGLMSLAVLVWLAYRSLGGPGIHQNLPQIYMCAFGIWFIAYGPISRTTQNHRKLEVVLGTFVVISNLWILVEAIL